ncbi:MAG TPA: hypothetical protein VIG25_18040 [Pyrinomonadaceae bacterium]|jgi:hypothetical protein
MSKLIGFLIPLLLLVTSVTAQSDDTWVRLAPTGGGFAVMVPGKAEEQSFNKEEIFKSKIYTVILKNGSDGRAIYLAGFGDYAASVKIDPQAELNANRDNFIKELPGTRLLESHTITLDGRPGIEFTGDSDRATVTCRFYVAGNRVFQLAAMVFKGVDEKKNVNRFFDSFAFTN